MIKMLIADDHAIIRQGMKQILADTRDIVVAGEASCGKEALNLASKKNYDMVVLDITLPDGNGLDILKELKSIKPKLKVMIFSVHPEDQYAVRALRAGASGYLTKDSLPDELIAAIRMVALDRKYVSSSLVEKLASGLETGVERPLHHALSDREYDVMHMIASGKRLTEIADELFLSVKTISTYRSRILLKMRMKNDMELIRYSLENRLID
jgi:two-component system invasion response regulator UvrY